MERHQEDSALFPSLPFLFNRLEKILATEYRHHHTPWMQVNQLKEIALQQYGFELDRLACHYGYQDDLKRLLISSHRFAIYSTPVPQQFYVALLQNTVSNYSPNPGRPLPYKVKRPWKLDRRLIDLVKAEGVEEKKTSRLQPSTGPSTYEPRILTSITSSHDLQAALIEIIKGLTCYDSRRATTIGMLTKRFYICYKQPLRMVVRTVCSDMMLIDVLKLMPEIEIEEDDDGSMLITYMVRN